MKVTGNIVRYKNLNGDWVDRNSTQQAEIELPTVNGSRLEDDAYNDKMLVELNRSDVNFLKCHDKVVYIFDTPPEVKEEKEERKEEGMGEKSYQTIPTCNNCLFTDRCSEVRYGNKCSMWQFGYVQTLEKETKQSVDWEALKIPVLHLTEHIGRKNIYDITDKHNTLVDIVQKISERVK